MTEERKKVAYRGVSMTKGWPEKIAAAQLIQTCFIDEREVSRVRYDDEPDDWGANEPPCHDCAVLNVEGCDV